MADFSQQDNDKAPRPARRRSAGACAREVRLSHFDAAIRRRRAACLTGERSSTPSLPHRSTAVVNNTPTLKADPKHEATLQS